MSNQPFRRIGERVCIQPGCTITGAESIAIGSAVHIGEGSVLQGEGGIEIGNNVVISFQCVLWSVNHQYEGELLPYDFVRLARPIRIDDHVWLGRNVLVNGGVTIGEGAVVGMGSVVVADVPPLAVVGGNPARVLRYRDRDRYEKLVRERRFLLEQPSDRCVACDGRLYRLQESG